MIFKKQINIIRINNALLLPQTDRFTIKILTSYNNHIGNATSESVNTSEVGVMIAATTRIITMACLR